MPCCAPRYGALIVAGIDFCVGAAGLVVLSLIVDSALILVCLPFPATLLCLLGILLTIAFLKKNQTVASICFGLNIVLVLGCAIIILILLIHREFKAFTFTPIIVAALFYTIVVQLHFSWVVHDFKTHRLLKGHHRRLQYEDSQSSDS